MANIQSNAAQPTVGGSGAGYSVPNKAVPLPRQWQLPPPQLSAPRNQVALQHFYPGQSGAGNRRQATPSRRMERAILLGLWMLVMLTAIAIGLRMFDLSGTPAAPTEALVRLPGSDDAVNAMRNAVITAPRPGDSDPFDDIVPTPALLEPAPPTIPSTRLTPAVTLAIEPPAAPLAVAVAGRASREPVCADAIRAMQLCPD